MNPYPPAQVNKMVTEARNRWFMAQSTTITITIPNGVKAHRDLDAAEWMVMLKEWQKTNGSLEMSSTRPDIQDYPIDDDVRSVMLREFAYILEYNGFESELLASGDLRISKGCWSTVIESVLEKMPFPDWLPHEIWKRYKHSLHESQSAGCSQDAYPSRERLESIRQAIVSSMVLDSALKSE